MKPFIFAMTLVFGSLIVAQTRTETRTTTTTIVTNDDVVFDVRQGDDRGKLVITSQGVNFENLSDAKHSRRWTYAEIKELKREGDKKIEIESVSGKDTEFRVEGSKGMSDAVYKMIGDRIAAARSR